MRREGRQHGMVRAYEVMPSQWNPRPNNSKIVNRFESPSTAGLFTRVPSKPTNHSKFTSKCGRRARCNGCHDQPTCKARDKAKGTQKTRASDLAMNHRLIALKIVNGGGRGFNCSGISATAILGHLGSDYDYEEDEEEEEEEEEIEAEDRVGDDLNDGFAEEAQEDLNDGFAEEAQEYLNDGFAEEAQENLNDGFAEEAQEEEIEVGEVEIEEHEDGDVDDDDDDVMSFCDVGFVIDQIDGDEEWCIVEEL